jgi:hypothetical protein
MIWEGQIKQWNYFQGDYFGGVKMEKINKRNFPIFLNLTALYIKVHNIYGRA